MRNMNLRQPTIKELHSLPEAERITPFSNGTEAMIWTDENCDRCVRAWFAKDGKWPDEKTLRSYMNNGKYCPIQYYLDVGVLIGYIPEDVAIVAGWRGSIAPQTCRFFSDDDNDKYKPPRKPKPTPQNQLTLDFVRKPDLACV